MKIILSRKGFDSSIGGVASPIFPSGELRSIPIPESILDRHSKRYYELQAGDHTLGSIVHDLSRGKIQSEAFAHLDPDLDASSIPRPPNWRPVFGQAGAAERHLQNQGVKEGDIFVFYGWFRQVECVSGKYRYVSTAADLHVIFGWLQIEQRLPIASFSEIPAWAHDHPHCKARKYSSLDSIYISSSHLQLHGIEIQKPGAGIFHRFTPELCLTASHQSRSNWQLPAWFYPRTPSSSLSYHSNLSRWELNSDTVLLRSVGRGQEFVLDCQEYPEAVQWLYHLLSIYDTFDQSHTSSSYEILNR